jgi:hypothetical protein
MPVLVKYSIKISKEGQAAQGQIYLDIYQRKGIYYLSFFLAAYVNFPI